MGSATRTRAGFAAGPRVKRIPVGVEARYFLQIATKLITECVGDAMKQPTLCET
jgi:hypothetical protein